MECNKEEAIKAKELAEKKLENKDYLGAQRIAIKAQKLYPQLDKISQLITVCDVHCAAAKKLQGTAMDWYGLLNVEPTADDILIKMQFRKLALILHPDKNKFVGAADAFKLVSEARGVLLDQEKRRTHDTLHTYTAADSAPKQGNSTSKTGSNSKDDPSVWTKCPFCGKEYMNLGDELNQDVCCPSCEKKYPGFEVKTQTAAGPSQQSAESNVAGSSRSSEAAPFMSCDQEHKGEKPESSNMNENKRKRNSDSDDSCNSDVDEKSGKEGSSEADIADIVSGNGDEEVKRSDSERKSRRQVKEPAWMKDYI